MPIGARFRLIYEESFPIGRAEAIATFAGADEAATCRALVGLALHDPDWRFVERWCVDFLDDDRPAVRGLAATCLGHLARLHGELNTDEVVPRLRKAQDALDDIGTFIGRRPAGPPQDDAPGGE